MDKLGVVTTYKNIEHLSVGECLERSASIVPDKVCISFKQGRITYRELDAQSTAVAASLQEIGIEKGERVAIYLSNCIELYVAFFALQKIGAVIAWVNSAHKINELTFILNNSQARAVFVQKGTVGSDNLGLVQESRGSAPHLSDVISIGVGCGEGVLCFEDMLSRGEEKRFTKPSIDIQQDLSMLIYTSGTTGVPKGSMITHRQVVRGAYSYVDGVRATADDIFAGILPLTHSYGCGTGLVQPVLIQASIALLEAFNAEDAFRLIELERATLQHGAPAHYILEMNHPNIDRYDLSSLRAGYLAGQICPEQVVQWGEDRNIYLAPFWGNSESGPGPGTMSPFGTLLDVRKKSVGKALTGTQVKAISIDGGNLAGTGEIGEMMIRGPHVLKAYWQDPDETRKQFEKDGWLHTGDLVSIDKNGFITVFGRNKDLINRGGLKIYPTEIESLILQHPCVSQVCVVGTPNPVLGESICACVIPKDGVKISLKEIREFCQDKVAKYKLPDELLIVSDFPKIAGGIKIRKFGAGGVQDLASTDKNREMLRQSI
ncbi:MAG: class I adenylate-forming enzyme family protein [Proteobacteria bacterium]|nr:class I adenylate-forming enzyme family protein [Pseudomonadota bacterium]